MNYKIKPSPRYNKPSYAVSNTDRYENSPKKNTSRQTIRTTTTKYEKNVQNDRIYHLNHNKLSIRQKDAFIDYYPALKAYKNTQINSYLPKLQVVSKGNEDYSDAHRIHKNSPNMKRMQIDYRSLRLG